ncbi:MAG: hypothetical protein ACREDL_16765, partial [Bradyrhizobium sp.]
VDGPTERLGDDIDHDSIESWADAASKVDSYSKAAAQQMFARGRRAPGIAAPLHGLAAFLKVYVLRLGFLDGATGWGVARYSALYASAKWRRLAESSAAKREGDAKEG